jgi:hypothetical protein
MAPVRAWTVALMLGIVIAGPGCAPPQVRVSVATAVIDRGHSSRAWYVEVVQERASGLLVTHAGVVCDDKPAIVRIDAPCPAEVTLSGEIWRLPDRAWCGRHAPPEPFEVAMSGARRIARLQPRTLFRGRRGECRDAYAVSLELWPPVDKEAAARLLWTNDDYWLAPEETPYVLESP